MGAGPNNFSAHLALFVFAFGSAYAVSRLSKGKEGEALRPLPLLMGIGAGGVGLMAGGYLSSREGLWLGAGVGLLYLWASAAGRVALLRRLNWLPLLACAGMAAGSGILVESIKVPFVPKIVPLGEVSLPLTIAWLWLVSYLMSSSSEAEETAPGLTAIIATTFLIISSMQAAFMGHLASALSVVVLGTCLGTIVSAAPKTTVRSGLGGRSALGFLLAVISVVGALKNTVFLILVVPFLVMAVPIMNVTYALLYSPRSAAPSLTVERTRQSLYNLLLAKGMPPGQIALLFYFGTAYLGAVAIVLVALIKVTFILKLLLMVLFLPTGFLAFYAAYKVLSPVAAGTQRTLELFGVPIANLTSQEALDRIAEFILSRRPHQVVTTDSSALVRAERDKELKTIMREADLVTPDGTGVVWAGRLLDQPIRERVSGVDLVDSVSRMAEERGFSVYLLGSQPGVAEEAGKALKAKYPALKILGSHHGYFSPEEEPKVVGAVSRLQPDVLFVALGVPRQEKWIRQNLEKLKVPVCIGVGGSFDVISGRVARAPLWIQRWGLEWLYRALKEPKRLPRLLALPRFFFMVARMFRGRLSQAKGQK